MGSVKLLPPTASGWTGMTPTNSLQKSKLPCDGKGASCFFRVRFAARERIVTALSFQTRVWGFSEGLCAVCWAAGVSENSSGCLFLLVWLFIIFTSPAYYKATL